MNAPAPDVRVRLPRTHRVLTRAGHQQGKGPLAVGWLCGSISIWACVMTPDMSLFAHLDDRRFPGDRHRFLGSPCTCIVTFRVVFAADRDGDVGHGHGAEALELGFQLVASGIEPREPEAAVGLGGGGSNRARVHVAGGGNHSREHASLRVADDARDDAVGGLRHRGSRHDGERDEQRRDSYPTAQACAAGTLAKHVAT